MRYRVQCGWLLPVSRPGRTLSPHLSEMRRHTRLSGRRRWDGLYRQRWVADNRCLKNFDERPHRRGRMFHCGKFNVAPVCFSSPPIGTLVDSVRRKSDVIFFQKFHFLLEDLDPWLGSVWLLWLTRVHFPAGISIGLSVFAVLILVSQKQTHRPRHSFCSNFVAIQCRELEFMALKCVQWCEWFYNVILLYSTLLYFTTYYQ